MQQQLGALVSAVPKREDGSPTFVLTTGKCDALLSYVPFDPAAELLATHVDPETGQLKIGLFIGCTDDACKVVPLT